MCSLINKQLLLTAYAYLFIMEQQKVQQGSEALELQMEKKTVNIDWQYYKKLDKALERDIYTKTHKERVWKEYFRLDDAEHLVVYEMARSDPAFGWGLASLCGIPEHPSKPLPWGLKQEDVKKAMVGAKRESIMQLLELEELMTEHKFSGNFWESVTLFVDLFQKRDSSGRQQLLQQAQVKPELERLFRDHRHFNSVPEERKAEIRNKLFQNGLNLPIMTAPQFLAAEKAEADVRATVEKIFKEFPDKGRWTLFPRRDQEGRRAAAFAEYRKEMMNKKLIWLLTLFDGLIDWPFALPKCTSQGNDRYCLAVPGSTFPTKDSDGKPDTDLVGYAPVLRTETKVEAPWGNGLEGWKRAAREFGQSLQRGDAFIDNWNRSWRNKQHEMLEGDMKACCGFMYQERQSLKKFQACAERHMALLKHRVPDGRYLLCQNDTLA